jgi:hypothetical protein
VIQIIRVLRRAAPAGEDGIEVTPTLTHRTPTRVGQPIELLDLAVEPEGKGTPRAPFFVFGVGKIQSPPLTLNAYIITPILTSLAVICCCPLAGNHADSVSSPADTLCTAWEAGNPSPRRKLDPSRSIGSPARSRRRSTACPQTHSFQPALPFFTPPPARHSHFQTARVAQIPGAVCYRVPPSISGPGWSAGARPRLRRGANPVAAARSFGS